MSELMTPILQVDNINATSPSPIMYKDRLSLQVEFNNLSTVQAEDMLLISQHTHYEYVDKASKLFARHPQLIKSLKLELPRVQQLILS